MLIAYNIVDGEGRHIYKEGQRTFTKVVRKFFDSVQLGLLCTVHTPKNQYVLQLIFEA